MMVAGGLDDQPAARWQARNQAGWIWRTLEKADQPNFEITSLPKDERKLIVRADDMRVKLAKLVERLPEPIERDEDDE